MCELELNYNYVSKENVQVTRPFIHLSRNLNLNIANIQFQFFLLSPGKSNMSLAPYVIVNKYSRNRT